MPMYESVLDTGFHYAQNYAFRILGRVFYTSPEGSSLQSILMMKLQPGHHKEGSS